MKLLLSFLWLGLNASAQTWQVYRFNGAWQFTPSPAYNGFAFAEYLYAPFFMAGCLTTTNAAGLIGDLSGKSLSASVAIQRTGNPEFVFGGQVPGWNTCPARANVRLYFSTNSAPYSVAAGVANETGYWWNSSGLTMQNLSSGYLFGSLADPSQWSDANGHSGSDPAFTAAFLAATINVRQIGLFFGGGCFYDVGVAVLHDTGTATFTLNGFTAGESHTIGAGEEDHEAP